MSSSVGGGVAGVSCAEELNRIWSDDDSARAHSACLITPSGFLKAARRTERLTEHLGVFEVEERKGIEGVGGGLYLGRFVRVVSGWVEEVRAESCELVLVVSSRKREASASRGTKRLREERVVVKYGRLAVCTGAQPQVLAPCRGEGKKGEEEEEEDRGEVESACLGVRDVGSIRELEQRLSAAKECLLVGNGGIALDLAHAIHKAQAKDRARGGRGSGLDGCRITWCVKDGYLGKTFLDRATAAFLLPFLFPRSDPQLAAPRRGSTGAGAGGAGVGGGVERAAASSLHAQACRRGPGSFGSSLGPHWLDQLGNGGDLERKDPTVRTGKPLHRESLRCCGGAGRGYLCLDGKCGGGGDDEMNLVQDLVQRTRKHGRRN